jgi:hypothetical protein
MLVSAQNASSAAGAVGRFVALSCDAGKSNVNRRDETNARKTAAGSAPHGLDNLKEFDDVDAALAAFVFCSERLAACRFFLGESFAARH